MFFEFLEAVLTLDMDYIAWLFFNNFHYLFAFGAMVFFFFEGKTKTAITAFGLFVLLAWAFYDFSTTSGWLFFVGGFLGMHYITKIAVLTYAEVDPRLSKYLLAINLVSGYAMLTIYNMFLV